MSLSCLAPSIANCLIIELVAAFFVGVFGASAYIVAVYCGFAGGKTPEERFMILEPFFDKRKNWFTRTGTIFLYCGCGGVLAAIFQLTTQSFAPIQSLLMGITWPMFISTLLSGRQVEPTREERDKIEKRAKIISTPIETIKQEEFEELLNKLTIEDTKSRTEKKKKQK